MVPSTYKKQPWEVRKLEFDVSPALSANDSVASVNSAKMYLNGNDVSNNMIVGNSTIVGNKVYVTVANGNNGDVCWLKLRVVSAGNDYIEDDIKVLIQERGM